MSKEKEVVQPWSGSQGSHWRIGDSFCCTGNAIEEFIFEPQGHFLSEISDEKAFLFLSGFGKSWCITA